MIAVVLMTFKDIKIHGCQDPNAELELLYHTKVVLASELLSLFMQ